MQPFPSSYLPEHPIAPGTILYQLEREDNGMGWLEFKTATIKSVVHLAESEADSHKYEIAWSCGKHSTSCDQAFIDGSYWPTKKIAQSVLITRLQGSNCWLESEQKKLAQQVRMNKEEILEATVINAD